MENMYIMLQPKCDFLKVLKETYVSYKNITMMLLLNNHMFC
jgi:hypothetical protein